MKWEKRTIAELITTKKGFAFQSKKYVDNGVPIVRVSDFTLDSISDNDLKYYPLSEKANYMEIVLHEKDVIIQTVGSWQNNPSSVVGKVVRVPYFLEGALLNQNAVKLIPNDNVVNDFLFYRLKTDEFKGHVIGEARGAANQASITLDTIKSFSFLCPPIETQRRIASILSAYDDLIENNQKQIKLLEEAAQRLYKEWFVDLHFPGWEETKIVDGLPEGWRKCLLSDVADINKLNLPKNYEFDSVDYVDLSSVKKGHILEKTRYAINEAPGRAKRLAVDGDIIWGMVRPNLCSYALVMHPDKRDVFSTGFAVITSKKVPFSYLYCLVTEERFIGYLVNCTNGAAYPAVKPIHFEEAKILKPTDNILNDFHIIAEPIYRKIEALDKMSLNLAEARDRLLPKLMSGELEV